MPQSVKLPSDAGKEIIAFMTRKDLIVLSQLNRQFAGIIFSPPFASKPLLQLAGAYIAPKWCCPDHGELAGVRFAAEFGTMSRFWVANLDSALCPKWIRFTAFFEIELPRKNKTGCEWFESLLANSDCLRDCQLLALKQRDGKKAMTAEMVELINKLRLLVRLVEID